MSDKISDRHSYLRPPVVSSKQSLSLGKIAMAVIHRRMCISKAYSLQTTTNRYHKAILMVIQPMVTMKIRQVGGVC